MKNKSLNEALVCFEREIPKSLLDLPPSTTTSQILNKMGIEKEKRLADYSIEI